MPTARHAARGVPARREHAQVLADVLRVLAHEPPPPLAVVATRANVPYDRLQRYLHELAARGLLEEAATPPRPTPKGLQLVAQSESWRRALRDAGLAMHDR